MLLGPEVEEPCGCCAPSCKAGAVPAPAPFFLLSYLRPTNESTTRSVPRVLLKTTVTSKFMNLLKKLFLEGKRWKICSQTYLEIINCCFELLILVHQSRNFISFGLWKELSAVRHKQPGVLQLNDKRWDQKLNVFKCTKMLPFCSTKSMNS